MAMEKVTTSYEEFLQVALQSGNESKIFEFINGEIIEVSPGRTRNSEFGQIFGFVVRLFCREHKLPCHTSGGDGAFRILDHVLAPDSAYKPTPMSNQYPDPVAPLLAVEIISPTDKAVDIHSKRLIYLEAGILYWEMYPDAPAIEVYAPGQPTRTFGIDDVLDGGDVLHGFTLPIRDIFAEAMS